MHAVTDERFEKALRYLPETDLAVAEAEAEMLRTEYRHKLIKDRVFLTASGSVAERQAAAGSSNEALAAHEEYLAALVRYRHVRAKRETESQIIGVYRTQESSRRLAA